MRRGVRYLFVAAAITALSLPVAGARATVNSELEEYRQVFGRLQDRTTAAMRDALRDMGSDPKRANPLIPADLVIDHSVQVDEFGTASAFGVNAAVV